MDLLQKIKIKLSNMQTKDLILDMAKAIKQPDFNMKDYYRDNIKTQVTLSNLLQTINRPGYIITKSDDTKNILISIADIASLNFVKLHVSEENLRRYGIIQHYSEIV